MGRKKECENELVKKQTYKFNNTVIKVEPVFKETGTRTLLHSLSRIIKDDIKDSWYFLCSHKYTVCTVYLAAEGRKDEKVK